MVDNSQIYSFDLSGFSPEMGNRNRILLDFYVRDMGEMEDLKMGLSEYFRMKEAEIVLYKELFEAAKKKGLKKVASTSMNFNYDDLEMNSLKVLHIINNSLQMSSLEEALLTE